MAGSQANRLAERGHRFFMAFQRDQRLAQIEMHLRQSRIQGEHLLASGHRFLESARPP